MLYFGVETDRMDTAKGRRMLNMFSERDVRAWSLTK